ELESVCGALLVHAIVGAKILEKFLNADAIGARADRRTDRHRALATLQKAPRFHRRRLRVRGDARALAHRAAVHVVLRPPDLRARAALQLRSVEVAHQRLLSWCRHLFEPSAPPLVGGARRFLTLRPCA